MSTQKILSLLTALFLFFGLITSVHATLVDNLDGTVTQTRNDGSRLMWLKDANLAGTTMTWDNAVAWANGLVYAGFNNWRLPETLPVNGASYDYNFAYDGSTDDGYNISAPGTVYEYSTGSEMAYMFYVELGNLGYYDTAGNVQAGWGLTNTGLFGTTLQPSTYWSGTEYAPVLDNAWVFDYNYGPGTGNPTKGGGNERNAWAVRPMSAIPEPTSLLLLGSGLVGIVAFKQRNQT